MLSVQGLSKRFGGVKAVSECSFSVEPNKITALIGPNGAGKSTVFNLVSGVLSPDAGKIVFDGADITGFLPEAVSKKGIARLFQKSSLFKNLSVRENLLLGLDSNDTGFVSNMVGRGSALLALEKPVSDSLALVGLKGIENKSAGELSFGQKRLVELSRTMLSPHKLLMLDEPVAGVNPKIRSEIAELLVELRKKGETVLLIEHDMNFTLSVSDRVIVMDDGRVIAEGSPKEIG